MSRVLRPHHGMCFQFYEGKGYSEDFTDHMGRIIREMEADPTQLITLKVKTDIVCENCPNNKSGKCTTQDKVKKYDKEVLKACDLKEGDEISYAEFEALVRERIIDAGIRSDICGDCSWDYICREKSVVLEAITRVTKMEELLDEVLKALDRAEESRETADREDGNSEDEFEADGQQEKEAAEAVAALNALQPQIDQLEEYYASQTWKDDFALDEAGKLPKDLKRGVLSEDGIYDALERYKESKGDSMQPGCSGNADEVSGK